MPIAVQCTCGQKLNVPDHMAGKQGKCPKCQQLLRIPSPAAGSPSPKTAAAAPAQSSAAPSAISNLLEEAGVGKPTGPTCPRCSAPLKRNSVLCTSCGLNLSTGEQLQQHQSQAEFSFGNMYLDEAVSNMKRDDKMHESHEKSGLPWYVMGILLLVVALCGIGAVLIVDSQLMGPQDPNTLVGRIQQFKIPFMIGIIIACASMLLNLAAVILTLVHAFSRSVGQGLLVMFCPFYIFVYQIMHWEDLKGSFMSLVLASVLGGVAGGLVGSSLPPPSAMNSTPWAVPSQLG